ncbi:MAG: hypothetical protein Q9176_007717 [Flavoplaca citrina]
MDPEAQAQTELKDFTSIFSLDGKVAVVTGGSRGLGLHAASGLLQAGCSKVYITSRKGAACDSACAALNALPNKRTGAQAISVPADSAKISGVEALFKEVSKTTDHVDILFANAGATWGEKFDTHPDSAFAKVMDLNVKSVFNTIRLFAPLLQKKATLESPSRVIVTASVAGLGVGTLGEQATFGYSASKAAVIHLTRNLAVELGPRHILCNSIAPGFFPSKMASGLMAMQGGEAELAKLNPNGRLGKPEDIAAAVSPSLPSGLHDPSKMAQLKEASEVQSKVAQFNNLSKEAVQRRKDNEAAMRRAVLGREEAENETKRLRDEYQGLRKELDEGKARERKVAQRIESVMVGGFAGILGASPNKTQEELHRTKEMQAHAQGVYEKEVRRARKEAFKSSSALVKLQEELKTTRNRYTLMREEVEVQKRKTEQKEQEAFASQYQLVGLQEELDRSKHQMRIVEEERDALKTNLKQEEVARIAAEGKIALPSSQETDEFASPKKRRRESAKENMDPRAMKVEDVDEMAHLRQDLRMEKRLRMEATGLIDFMKMECQFRCCPCRLAEQDGTRYIHDGSLEQEMDKMWSTIPRGHANNIQTKVPPQPEPSTSSRSSPLGAASPPGQTTEMLINFSPSTGIFLNTSTSAQRDLLDVPPVAAHEPEKEDHVASILYGPKPPLEPLPHLPPRPTPIASSYFPPSEQQIPIRTPRPLPHPPSTQQTPNRPTTRQPSTIRSVTYPTHTTTTSVPLAPIPVSPDRTITRDKALEQIRQRRGRARSIAAGNGTPKRGLVLGTPDARRNASAPARD